QWGKCKGQTPNCCSYPRTVVGRSLDGKVLRSVDTTRPLQGCAPRTKSLLLRRDRPLPAFPRIRDPRTLPPPVLRESPRPFGISPVLSHCRHRGGAISRGA